MAGLLGMPAPASPPSPRFLLHPALPGTIFGVTNCCSAFADLITGVATFQTAPGTPPPSCLAITMYVCAYCD